MPRVRCPSCRLAFDMQPDWQHCPYCGHDGNFPEDSGFVDDDDTYSAALGSPRSGPVTALGIVTILLGFLNLLCGSMLIIGGSLSFGARAHNMLSDSGVGAFVVTFGIVANIIGALKIVTGIGILKCRQWARITVLVFAGLYAALTVFHLFSLNAAGVVIHGGYAAFAFIVLLNKRAQEFH